MAALDVAAGDMVAFTGAGGKTSAMFRLAMELSAAGRSVLVATTTYIHEPLLNQVHVLLLEEDEDRLVAALPSALAAFRLVAAGPGLLETETGDAYRKLKPISKELADRIHRLRIADNILIEADGARGRSLKAPEPYEPVVPSTAGIVVSVAAVDVVGSRLSGGLVHRPQAVARAIQTSEEAIVTPRLVARLITSPDGGLKGCPDGARFIPLLNKAESQSSWTSGLTIAHRLLASPRVDRVIVGAVGGRMGCVRALVRTSPRSSAIAEPPSKVAAIVLAGGASRRYGGTKQLADVYGRTMLESVTQIALGSTADEVIVILGCGADDIAPRLGNLPVRMVVNEAWSEGIASSIRAGVVALGDEIAAAAFILGDQALLTTADVNVVIGGYRASRGTRLEDFGCTGCVPLSSRPTVIAPTFGGRPGNPVLFDRSLFSELLELRGDSGARGLVTAHADGVLEVEAPTGGVCIDVDRPEDLQALLSRGKP